MSKYNVSIDGVSVEAVFNKLGGIEGVRRFLRDELVVSKPTSSWREEDGVFYFSVTSDGTTGEDWIKRLSGSGFLVGDYARQVLGSPEFKPTTGVVTDLAVIGGMFFENSNLTMNEIGTKANSRGLMKPNAEVACLIREKFTDKEIEAMGFVSIVAAHEPISDSDGDLCMLYVSHVGSGGWLDVYFNEIGSERLRDSGFAFAVSQVRSQS